VAACRGGGARAWGGAGQRRRAGVAATFLSDQRLAVGGCLHDCYNDIREKSNVEMIFERSHTLQSDIMKKN
jgi:hypothetical protein